MIWNGTDPLQPDHEVAYRGWPTERVWIACVIHRAGVVTSDDAGFCIFLDADGSHPFGNSDFDLIPLQQQEPAK